MELVFFLVTMMCYLYGVSRHLIMYIEFPNYIDIITSGIFFTAMWYMAIKKLRTGPFGLLVILITIPFYAYRGLGMLSLAISYLYSSSNLWIYRMEEKLKQQPSNCLKVVLFGPESTGKTTLSNN